MTLENTPCSTNCFVVLSTTSITYQFLSASTPTVDHNFTSFYKHGHFYWMPARPLLDAKLSTLIMYVFKGFELL